jgi:hypothetical protein
VASKSFPVEIKDIDGMVAAVTKAAKAKDIAFNGDNKKGSGGKLGAKISYVVKDHTVTFTVEDSMLSRMGDVSI